MNIHHNTGTHQLMVWVGRMTSWVKHLNDKSGHPPQHSEHSAAGQAVHGGEHGLLIPRTTTDRWCHQTNVTPRPWRICLHPQSQTSDYDEHPTNLFAGEDTWTKTLKLFWRNISDAQIKCKSSYVNWNCFCTIQPEFTWIKETWLETNRWLP